MMVVVGYGGLVQLLVVTAAAPDQTGRTISLLVAGLVGVAVALMALTVWYWRHTDPKRRAGPPATPEEQTIEIVEARSGSFDEMEDLDRVGPPVPVSDRSAVVSLRPLVASIPPESEAEGAVATAARDDRRWVDPDAWVDAFASGPGGGASPTASAPGGEASPTASVLDDENRLASVGKWFDQTVSVGSGPHPAGRSLSDVEWDAVTNAAFNKFAETESPVSTDVEGENPVR